jgi:uncharacterized protein (TIGR02145 family)
MSNFFYRRLNFFDKQGSPLNFDYIGPTGPTPVDSNFVFMTSSGSATVGTFDVDLFDSEPASLTFNLNDVNGFNISAWANEVFDFLQKGADVYLNGRISGQQEFKGKILSVTSNIGTYQIDFYPGQVSGQRSVGSGYLVYFDTTYEYRPGGYFKGNIYFDPVSSGLYENEQIFIVQEMYSGSGELTYGLPHTGFTGGTGGSGGIGKWRTRWYNDKYGETDVSDILFTYKIEDRLSGGDGYPLIVNYPNIVLEVDASPYDDYYDNIGGYIQTSKVTSESLCINVALNSGDLYSNIYERKLIVEDITQTVPVKVLEIDFYGEIVGEDERFKVLLQNLGRAFYQTDSTIIRDHDPEEPLPNYLEINEKRKELLVAGESIFPYIGSYKGLVNALKFFGYQDLRIKEYWLNLQYEKILPTSPLQNNQDFLDQIKIDQAKTGYSQSYQISDVLDNENSGKYKLTQTYGPDKDGIPVLTLSSEDTLLPSMTYKKTSLFGLYYDLNKTTGEDSDYNYPEVVDAFSFTQEEVLLKLFALKERLKKDYLPLNARIVDITGEGIYFDIYNTRSWTDLMARPEIEAGFDFQIRSNPDFGFLEDLRNFSTRPSSISLQTPSNYFNEYKINVKSIGGTGSALYFTGSTGSISPLPNATLLVTAGKTYEFSMETIGFDFYITTDSSLSSVTSPVGLDNNGATSGSGYNMTWYVNPLQESPVYYFSPQNPSLLNGQISILPSTISDLGNTVDPLSNEQKFSAADNASMISAISNFYDLKQQGIIKNLGDGNYDPPAYTDPDTGLTYQTPIGMPIVLELIPDRWTWDELNLNWSAIILPVFSVGARVSVKTKSSSYYGEFGTVTDVSYSTGQYTVKLDLHVSPVTFDESDLFSSSQTYGIMTWENIDFSNMVEIEWIVNKSATQEGSPYNFKFRGSIVDFHNLAHFVPYTGEYRVTCNVIDGFNFKNTVIEDAAIKVSPKIIEIDAWTRYREVENYEWQDVYKGWEDYSSIWEFPGEGSSIEVLEKTIPNEILNFATYGNKAEEGQSMYVKSKTQPVSAYGTIVLSQTTLGINDISSYFIQGSQYGYVTITTSNPHNLKTGDIISLQKTIPQIEGRWRITVPADSDTTLIIPVVLQAGWTGVYAASSPSRLTIDDSISGYPNQYLTGPGSISVSVDNREIGSASAEDSLYRTVNSLISSINSLRTYPDYFAYCNDPSLNPATIKIFAPTNLGASQNGVPMSVTSSGYISVSSSSLGLSGGVDPKDTYEYWSESNTYLPNKNLKYWGTKKLTWNIFDNNTWDNAYAHGWYDFEFNNDWLGGYELHNITPGDNIKLSTSNETYPFPVGVTIQPGLSGLTIQEVADQLNSASDRYITDFYYRPIPTESGTLPMNSPPMNLSVNNFTIPISTYPAPTSVPGGNPLLRASFGYTGGSISPSFQPQVQIGDLIWSTVNLTVETYKNGDPIPQVTDQTQWETIRTGAWCYYNNDPANGEIYGKLYNAYAVLDPRGLAPDGWHIPSLNEFNYLISRTVDDNFNQLKEGGTAHWNSPNTSTNPLGFTALPGSYRDSNGTFGTPTFLPLGDYAAFWSYTQFSPDTLYFMEIYGENLGGGGDIVGGYSSTMGFSVRLVKNY